MRIFSNTTPGRYTCLCRVLEILASTVLCQLSHWFSHCVLIYLIVVFVLLNTHKSCVCVLASPIMLAPAGYSNMFSVTHYNRTLTWFHPVHSINPIFIKMRFDIVLPFIFTYHKWSPLFDL